MEAATATDANRESIEEMAGNGGAEQEQEEFLVGTSGQLSFTVGGKKPSGSTVSIGSASREVEGQFQKGDTIVLKVIARVDEVAFIDKHDNHGTAIDCTRKHSVKPLSVQVVGEPGNDED